MKTGIAVVLGGLLAASSACAQFGGGRAPADRRFSPPDPFLLALDTNRDGELSAAELRAAPSTLKRLDADRNGGISMNEYMNAMRRMMQRGRFGSRGGGPPSRSGGPGGRGGSSRIERSGLKVGADVSHLAAHNAEGKEFSFSQLKGGHTVLVFGCLT